MEPLTDLIIPLARLEADPLLTSLDLALSPGYMSVVLQCFRHLFLVSESLLPCHAYRPQHKPLGVFPHPSDA